MDKRHSSHLLLLAYLYIQAAVAEPERVRLIHQARSINDAMHAVNQVSNEAKDDTAEVRRKKCMEIAPAYLKERVERGQDLPEVEIVGDDDDEEEQEEEVARAVLEHVVIDGKLVKELYVEVMEYMLPTWDDERKRD